MKGKKRKKKLLQHGKFIFGQLHLIAIRLSLKKANSKKLKANWDQLACNFHSFQHSQHTVMDEY